MGTPVSARAAAAARRDGTGAASSADAENARAEAAAAAEDLQRRLEQEEKRTEGLTKEAAVLQVKLDEALKESARLEEQTHEYEEQIESLNNEKRDFTRQIREMAQIYETERSAMLKEKEDLFTRDEEMQDIIARLKENLAQRNNGGDDDGRPARQRMYYPSAGHPWPKFHPSRQLTFYPVQPMPRRRSMGAVLPRRLPSNEVTLAAAPS